MKRTIKILATALLAGIIFISCDKDDSNSNNNNNQNGDNTNPTDTTATISYKNIINTTWVSDSIYDYSHEYNTYDCEFELKLEFKSDYEVDYTVTTLKYIKIIHDSSPYEGEYDYTDNYPPVVRNYQYNYTYPNTEIYDPKTGNVVYNGVIDTVKNILRLKAGNIVIRDYELKE